MTNSIKINLPRTATTQAPELKTLHKANPELTLHLQADQDVPYRVVAKVMAVIERSGVTRLAVITANQ